MGKVVKSAATAVAAVAVGSAIALIGGPLAVAIGASIALAGVAKFATSVLQQIGLGPKAPKPSPTSPQSYRQSIGQSNIVYGKARLGGLISFYHAAQGDNEYRYFVIALAGHSVRSVTKFYLNDEPVTVDGAGKVTSGPYANAAWLWAETGSPDAAANATFVAECEGRWTGSHRGRGIAKIFAKFHLTDAVIAEGMPNITAEVEGKNDIYDPRTETHGYTDNAILCIYDWLRMARGDGGFGVGNDEIDWDFVASQANICDERVPLKAGGSEKRYTLNGAIVTGAAPDEIRDTLLTACAGEFTYSGGLFKVYAGAYRLPSGAPLSEGDLVANIKVAPLSSGDQIANEIRGTFSDPSQNYQPAEYPARTLPTLDDLRTIDLELPFTKSHTMAQRIAKIVLMRASAERTTVWPMNLKGLATEALDTVTINTVRYGLGNYAWKVMGWSLAEDFSVILNLREEDPDFYAWNPATDEQDMPTATAKIKQPVGGLIGTGLPPAGMAAEADTASQITVNFTLPHTSAVVGWEIWQSRSSTFESAELAMSGVGYPGVAISEPITGLTAATRYFFWARARLGSGLYSPMASASATTL